MVTARLAAFRNSRMLLAAIALCVASLLPAHVAQAQLSRFDEGALIDSMRREQMGELLLHFLEIEPPADPVITSQARVAQLLIEYKRKDGRAAKARDEATKNALMAQSRADFDAALAEWRKLIAEHYEHAMRPIWETDLAEQLLFEYLQTMKQNAAEFYDYGVLKDEQRDAFENAVPEAINVISSADFGFFNRQTELPNEPDHVEKRVNTQIWHRMMEVYYKAKTKFYLAHGAYYTALLPDSHTYYKTLDPNNKMIRGQAATPPAERVRLLRQADTALTDVIEGIERAGRDDYGIKTMCYVLRGRVRSLLATLTDPPGDQAEPIETLTREADAPGDDKLTPLVARLALARALERSGDRDAGMEQLVTAQDNSLSRENLFIRLLTVDAMHRTRLRQAEAATTPEQRSTLSADAYAVYLELLNDTDMDQGTALGLRNYIYQRWASSVGENADLSATPAMVVAAIGETLRFTAQNLLVKAQSAEQEAKDARAEGREDDAAAAEARAEALTAEAQPSLTRALKVNSDLVAREGLLPAVRANAMFNHGASLFWAGRKNLGQVIEACDLFTNIADQYPDQRVGEEALGNALDILRGWYESLPSPSELLLAAYRHAMEVAMDKYPRSAVTARHCLAFAKNVLIPRREYETALNALQLVPVGHEDYAGAQTAMLIAMKQWFSSMTDDAEKQVLAQRIEREADRIIDEVDRAMSGAGPDKAHVLRLAKGTAVLARADIAAARGEVDQAVELLDDFENVFKDHEALVGEAMANRLIYLARAGDFAAVREGAAELMARHPDRAAGVISNLVGDLANEIERLTKIQQNKLEAGEVREEAAKRARDIAETVLLLADQLLEWAQGRDFNELQLIPYHLIRARALALTGRADLAVAVVKPIFDKYPNDPVILNDMAEAYFHRATQANPIDKASLKTDAAPLFSRLIAGLQGQRRPDGTYPDEYWNAWVKYLTILDLVGENLKDIPNRVRVLKVRNPDLGGDQYRLPLEALATKHAGS